MANENEILELQRAIVVALRGDAAFMAAAGNVWDRVPDNAKPPHVQVGSGTSTGWDTFGQDGFDVTMTMLVWIEKGNAKPGLEILAHMDRVLDEAALAPTGFRVVRIWREWADTAPRDPDGVTRSIPVRYRAWMQRT